MVYERNMKTAYSEVYIFLNMLGESYINKISKKVFEAIKNNRDLNYNPEIKITNDGNLNFEFSREALALISALNLQYFCKDNVEKQKYVQRYNENNKEEQERLKEIYDPYKKFEKINKEKISNTQNDNPITDLSPIKRENSLLSKIKHFVKSFINKFKK